MQFRMLFYQFRKLEIQLLTLATSYQVVAGLCLFDNLIFENHHCLCMDAHVLMHSF